MYKSAISQTCTPSSLPRPTQTAEFLRRTALASAAESVEEAEGETSGGLGFRVLGFGFRV